MGKLLLLFTVVPLVELYLLVWVAERVGFWSTVALVLLTGALGAAMARAEGLRVFTSWQRALAQGRLPADGVVSGLLVLVGGVLLVTPGVLTDAVGFCLLLPPTRRLVAALLTARLEQAIARGSVHVVRGGPFGGGIGYSSHPSARPRTERPEGEVIDTEGEVVEPD
jgi:UPF0716 protein FxsA